MGERLRAVAEAWGQRWAEIRWIAKEVRRQDSGVEGRGLLCCGCLGGFLPVLVGECPVPTC